MGKVNRIKLFIRSSLFFITLIFYLINPTLLLQVLDYHLLFMPLKYWIFLLLLGEMTEVLFPRLNKYVPCGKLFAHHYEPVTILPPAELVKEDLRRSNRGAVYSGLFWFFLLGLIGLIYYVFDLSAGFLYLATLFFYMSDQICINIWCPFRSIIIKNRCCTNCRIYNWGYFMIFSPLFYLPNPFTYTLVFLSTILLVQWELMHKRHPERFSALTNKKLQCSECREGYTCKKKKGTGYQADNSMVN